MNITHDEAMAAVQELIDRTNTLRVPAHPRDADLVVAAYIDQLERQLADWMTLAMTRGTTIDRLKEEARKPPDWLAVRACPKCWGTGAQKTITRGVYVEVQCATCEGSGRLKEATDGKREVCWSDAAIEVIGIAECHRWEPLIRLLIRSLCLATWRQHRIRGVDLTIMHDGGGIYVALAAEVDTAGV